MSQLLIIEASAGSGKTFRLTEEYLKLLFLDTKNYKHILAVTFTNKATEEMKSRILQELIKLTHICNSQCQHPCSNISAHYNTIHKTLSTKYKNVDQQFISQKAYEALNHILHNYSRFSISTIDSFFQKIIRAFLREIGISPNYMIELDVDYILQKTIDRLLKKIDSDKQLRSWLTNFALENLEEGKNWDFNKYLLDLGKELISERFTSLPAEFREKLTNSNFRQQLMQFKEKVGQAISNFESTLIRLATEASKIMEAYHVSIDDFKYKSQNGLGKYITELKNGEIKLPGDRLRGLLNKSIVEWVNENPESKNRALQALQNGLRDKTFDILKHFESNYSEYISAKLIYKNIFTFGVISDIAETLKEVLREENKLLLNQTTELLNKVIEQNDAPFVYEKVGQLYKHYMIDEFQDTSQVQWKNMLPLVSESLANNYKTLLVGDVKQSIYRWRNTDWRIMQFQAEHDLKKFLPDEWSKTRLDTNWRSLTNIIDFNNLFFELAKKYLNLDEFKNNENYLSDIYANIKQHSPQNQNNDHAGYVQVTMLDKDYKKKYSENYFIENEIVAIIHQLIKEKGYRQKDIAILVRKNEEGVKILKLINQYNASVDKELQIQVLSNESALLQNSIVVNFIIELYYFLVNPDDLVNQLAIVTHLKQIEKIRTNKSSAIIDFNDIEINNETVLIKDFPDFIYKNRELLLSKNSKELFEYLVFEFNLNQIPEFLPYLQALHNQIHNFVINNDSLVASFLEYWELKKDNLSIEISDNQDAVRILTIHKSKGLEFPNVIIPFCNWQMEPTGSTKKNFLWCPTENSSFNEIEYIPILYEQKMLDSQFKNSYSEERQQIIVDNLNLLYVAFTRAKNNLFIFFNQSGVGDIGNKIERIISHLFNSTSEYKKTFIKGSITPNTIIEKQVDGYRLTQYACYPISEKIKQRPAILNPVLELEEKNQLPSFRGNVLHFIFQHIVTVNDIEKAVDKAILIGYILPSAKNEYVSLIKELIYQSEVLDWFNNQWKVYNERTLLVPGQHHYRPDRVLVKDKSAIVIDYKFGNVEKTTYRSQVKTYMNYLLQMNYTHVKGFIWYVLLNKVEQIDF